MNQPRSVRSQGGGGARRSRALYHNLKANYDKLKASHAKLVEACNSFLKFADTDLPKGMICLVPEDWLDELRCNASAIKRHVKALKEAGEIE